MRTLLLLAVTLAVGIGLGFLVQWHFRFGGDASYTNLTMRIAGRVDDDLDKPLPPALVGEDWKYPGAHTGGTSTGGGGSANGRSFGPIAYTAKWITPDDFDKVVDFYAEKGNFDRDLLKRSPTAGGIIGGSGGVRFIESDNSAFPDPAKPGQLRPVRCRCLIRRSRADILVVFVTRGDTEKHTHIVLFYEPQLVNQGSREILLKLLEAKFGPITPEVGKRMADLRTDKLRLLSMKLGKAESLKELGLQD